MERLDVEPRARVEQEHALRAARRRHDAPRGVQPARSPSEARARARPRGCRARSACSSAGSSTSSTVRSTERTARLSSMIRSASCSSKWSKASSSRLGELGPLAALAGELDRGRDVVRLEQCAAERLELGQVVLAVTALRPARLRIAEAALPAAQRVGAHPQELGRCVGPDTAHVASVSGESQKCSAITFHVRPTSWGVRCALAQVFGICASNLRQVSACWIRCCATRAVVLAQAGRSAHAAEPHACARPAQWGAQRRPNSLGSTVSSAARGGPQVAIRAAIVPTDRTASAASRRTGMTTGSQGRWAATAAPCERAGRRRAGSSPGRAGSSRSESSPCRSSARRPRSPRSRGARSRGSGRRRPRPGARRAGR